MVNARPAAELYLRQQCITGAAALRLLLYSAAETTCLIGMILHISTAQRWSSPYILTVAKQDYVSTAHTDSVTSKCNERCYFRLSLTSTRVRTYTRRVGARVREWEWVKQIQFQLIFYEQFYLVFVSFVFILYLKQHQTFPKEKKNYEKGTHIIHVIKFSNTQSI